MRNARSAYGQYLPRNTSVPTGSEGERRKCSVCRHEYRRSAAARDRATCREALAARRSGVRSPLAPLAEMPRIARLSPSDPTSPRAPQERRAKLETGVIVTPARGSRLGEQRVEAATPSRRTIRAPAPRGEGHRPAPAAPISRPRATSAAHGHHSALVDDRAATLPRKARSATQRPRPPRPGWTGIAGPFGRPARRRRRDHNNQRQASLFRCASWRQRSP